MPPAGRLGDLSFIPRDAHGCPSCPHPGIGPALQGSGNVKINGRPALRVGDRGLHAACCNTNMWSAMTGSPTVFINGKKAHRVLDVDSHCGGLGMLVIGSPNVIIGGGFDFGGLALGLVSGAIGSAAAAQVAGPIAAVSNQLAALGVGPIAVSAVSGALSGAVSGAVGGAVSGAVLGGPNGALSGMLGGLQSGAVNGAISGAVLGLRAELSKTLADARSDVDADIRKMGEPEFQARKDALLREAQSLPRDDFYGSDLHQQYGRTVEYLTGGRITAAEAMQLNPTGGITGPGGGGFAINGGPIGTHAVRHDAQGFLYSTFDGAGPGYGGLAPGQPTSGQVVGVIRELVNPTEIPPPPKPPRP